jgi:opacity protein-like surface antigen
MRTGHRIGAMTLACAVIGTIAAPLTAHAQTVAGLGTTPSSRGYIEAVAQSTFGNVTSQSYGGEFGVTLTYGLQFFVEAGRTGDVATSLTQSAAQMIATGVAADLPGVMAHVRQPVTFGVAGLKIVPSDGPVQPYGMAGFGAARIKNDVTFTVNGADVTSTLPGVTLGTDLSGSVTKPMLTLGGGVMWAAWRHLALDFQFRYGRIFADQEGINVTRAGIGAGVRFELPPD